MVVEGTLLNNTFIYSTSLIDLYCLYTLPQSIYTHDEKCLHRLHRSYLGVVAAVEEEAGVRGRVAAAVEVEAGVRGRAATSEEEIGSSDVDGDGGDWQS
jgi:hypothetical protein